MQGICSLIWTNLFLLQNVSLAFDEALFGKIANSQQCTIRVDLQMWQGRYHKIDVVHVKDIWYWICPKYNFPPNFCIGSFAVKSRVFGHIWNIRRNTFAEPLLSSPHRKTQNTRNSLVLLIHQNHNLMIYTSLWIRGEYVNTYPKNGPFHSSTLSLSFTYTYVSREQIWGM